MSPKTEIGIKLLEECDKSGKFWFLTVYDYKNNSWVCSSGFPSNPKLFKSIKNLVIELVEQWYHKVKKMTTEDIEKNFDHEVAIRKSN